MNNNKFQKGNVLVISAGHFFHDVYSSILAPLLPVLIAQLNIPLSMSGWLDLARKIPALFNPLFGLMADRKSAKYLVIFTPATTAITMSLLGVAPNLPVLFILLFVSGISTTLFHVPSPAMIKQVAGNKTGAGMSFFMLGGELARTIGPLIITGAISLWGIEGSYKIMPLGIVASFILYYKLRNFSSTQINTRDNKPENIKTILKRFIPFFSVISAYSLFRAGMKTAITLYLPLYLINTGESLWFASISLSILQLSGAVGTLLAGHISDKIGRKNILLISGIVSPILMWIFISATGYFATGLLILLGIFLFAANPAILALVHDTNSDRPSFINSIYMTISFGITSIVALSIGYLGENIGLESTFKFCTILSVFSVPFVFAIPSIMKNFNN